MGRNLNSDEKARRNVLVNSTVIAVVGMSNDPMYTSYGVGKYLQSVGYTVYPVNPNINDIDGDPVYRTLKDVPEPIDIVNVFRKSIYLPEIVEEAAAAGARTVWAQEEVFSEEAALKALNAGLNIAMDLCIRSEHQKLFDGMVQG